MNQKRNNKLYDTWSVVHFGTGVIAGLLLPLWLACLVLIVWEPVEIFILSPLLAKKHIEFGYETLRNSLSDIGFDLAGVVLGITVLHLLT